MKAFLRLLAALAVVVGLCSNVNAQRTEVINPDGSGVVLITLLDAVAFTDEGLRAGDPAWAMLSERVEYGVIDVADNGQGVAECSHSRFNGEVITDVYTFKVPTSDLPSGDQAFAPLLRMGRDGVLRTYPLDPTTVTTAVLRYYYQLGQLPAPFVDELRARTD